MMKTNENFEDIYLKYRKFSVNVAFKVVKNRTVAEDISQDTFYELYRLGENLDTSNEAMLKSLIFTATLNNARDYIKSAYVRRECQQDEAEYENGEEKIGDERYNPELRILRMEENEYKSLVLQKLRDTNPENYDIFVKTKIMGASADSVAEEYGLTRNSVNNRNLRTKAWLKKEFAKLYHKKK